MVRKKTRLGGFFVAWGKRFGAKIIAHKKARYQGGLFCGFKRLQQVR
jgi:hypothetical protein